MEKMIEVYVSAVELRGGAAFVTLTRKKKGGEAVLQMTADKGREYLDAMDEAKPFRVSAKLVAA